jgi:hypothetical protein
MPLVTACWSVRILDTAEAPASARRTLARQLLEAKARHLGVSLEVGAHSARRGEGSARVAYYRGG